MIWLWTGMALLVVVLVLLDRYVLHPRPEAVPPLAAVARALFWFLFAMLFALGVFFLYETHWHDVGLNHRAGRIDGATAALQFLTALMMELCLDLDTVFVISAIFAHLHIPEKFQHRVLFWGVIVSIVTRGALVLAAGSILDRWDGFRFILAGLLVLAALRMILIRQENTDPEKNLIVRFLRRFVHVSERIDGSDLLTRVNGRAALTPLLVTLLLVETADTFFAFDSIPASYAVTREPFLIFSANVFAVLVLRALYPALVSLRGWLRYVKIGLAMILAYAAIAIALPVHMPPTEASLAAVLTAAGVGVFFAARWGSARQAVALDSPLGPEAERLARMTLKPARKIIVLVVGMLVTVVGIIMIGPVPGPGIVVVPIGLGILAAEFVWARRLLSKYSEHAQKIGKKAEKVLLKKPRPWLIPIVLGLTCGVIAFVWSARPFGVTKGMILSVAVPTLIGQFVWAGLTIQRARELKKAEPRPADTNADADQPRTPDAA